MRQTPEQLLDQARAARRREAPSCSRCTSPTATPRPTTWCMAAAARVGRAADAVLPGQARGRLPVGRGRALAGQRSSGGIKLHPRAEQFTLDHPDGPGAGCGRPRARAADADPRRPGIPALGAHAVQLAAEFPQRVFHPRPRRDVRSVVDLAGRPPTTRTCCSTPHGGCRPTSGAVLAGAPRPDPVRLRLALRARPRLGGLPAALALQVGLSPRAGPLDRLRAVAADRRRRAAACPPARRSASASARRTCCSIALRVPDAGSDRDDARQRGGPEMLALARLACDVPDGDRRRAGVRGDPRACSMPSIRPAPRTRSTGGAWRC